MKIAELRVGNENVSLEAELAEKGEVRDVVTKFGKRLKVCNCVIRDENRGDSSVRLE